MLSRRERRLIDQLSLQPLDRLEETCRSEKHRLKFSNLSNDSLHLLIRKEYPRFLALKTFCRDFTHPRFVAPSPVVGTVWKIHVVDEDDYEHVCRSIHDGHRVGQDGQDGPDATGSEDDEDVERPGKFRLILYPQPEHKSEESKWTKKALAMTRRLYRLYFNEAPPMEIWSDGPVEASNQQPPTLEANSTSEHNHRRSRVDSEPTRPPPTLQRPLPSPSHHHSHRKVQAPVIKKELPDENSPLKSRRRNSPSNDASSTPVRRISMPETRTVVNYFPPQDVATPSTSTGGRRPTSSKRPHPSPHGHAWPAISHYGLYRPALRRRRISHEGLLVVVPILSSASTSAKLSAPIRGSAESYGVDTPFQVYMSVFDTVRQLKEKIWSEKGVPVNRQVIWIGDNAVLNEGQKLGDLGVAVGDLDDGLGSNSEGKDVIGLQVIKDLKSEPEDKVKNPASPVVSNDNKTI